MQIAIVALETRRAFDQGEDGQRAFEAAVREELVRRRISDDVIALNRLPTEERLRALTSIQRRKREADRTADAVPGMALLTERLLRAAGTLAHHREFVPCRVVAKSGSVTACQLMGPGEALGTALVRRWCDHSPAGRAVRLEEIALPAAVAERLEAVAAEQSAW